MTTIEIKPNNMISNDPCAICGARCDPTGTDPFLAGTQRLVCDDCARRHGAADDLDAGRAAPRAFSNELLADFVDAHWEMKPRVRDRLVEQLADFTVHEVILRLVYQLTDDRDDYGDGTGGKWGGAWIELDAINGQRRVQLVEVDTEHRPVEQLDVGACPECGAHSAVHSIGRQHWGTCDTHRTRWLIGSNLFTGWQHQTEGEQRHAYEVAPGWGAYHDTDTAIV